MSSKRPFCYCGKICHPSRLAAKMFAFRKGGAQTAYPCYKGVKKYGTVHWHLTSERGTVKQVRR